MPDPPEELAGSFATIRATATQGLAELRRFLDDMWASSLDVARRIVEAERGLTDDDQSARTG